MATIQNPRIIYLQSESPRTLPVELSTDYTIAGEVTGNVSGSVNNTAAATIDLGALRSIDIWDGLGQIGFGTTIGGLPTGATFNTNISLSSSGQLTNSGGGTSNLGSVSALPWGNIAGPKPPLDADATQDILESASTSIVINSGSLFNIYGSGAAGVFIGAGGLFGRNSGGATTFSIESSSGDVTYAGDITGGANIDISGTARFNGSVPSGSSNYAGVFNNAGGALSGIVGYGSGGSGVVGAASGSGSGVQGSNTGGGTGVFGFSSGTGVYGQGIGSGTGVVAISGSGFALDVRGTMKISTQTISNLTAGNALSANNASFATTAGNANSLGGVDDSNWCRGILTNSGTANAAGYGFSLTSTVAGVRTRVTSANNIVIESFSDPRGKYAIKGETYGLDFVRKMKPIAYMDEYMPGVWKHGFSAHDMRDIVTEKNDALAYEHGDGMVGTDYMCTPSILVKAVQDLDAALTAAQETIKRYKQEMETIRDELAQLRGRI
jgi:hypothetical protein